MLGFSPEEISGLGVGNKFKWKYIWEKEIFFDIFNQALTVWGEKVFASQFINKSTWAILLLTPLWVTLTSC